MFLVMCFNNCSIVFNYAIRPRRLHNYVNGALALVDVDVVNPDEKSIMTYVAQFLQYSKNLPESEEDMQVCLCGLSVRHFQMNVLSLPSLYLSQ